MIDDALRQPALVRLTASGPRNHPAVVSPASISGSACGSGGELDSRIALLHNRLDEIYSNRLELPAIESRSEPQHALYAFSQTVLRFQIPKQHFLDFAETHRMNATIVRYATWSSLQRYLHNSSGVIAESIASVLGLQHSDAARQLSHLGVAAALAQLLFNLKSDAANGRILLPLEDLARARYCESDLFSATVNDAFRGMIQLQVTRCRDLLRQAAENICWLADLGSRLAVSSLIFHQLAILRSIEHHNFNVLTPIPIRRSTPLTYLPRAWRLARRLPSNPLLDVFNWQRTINH